MNALAKFALSLLFVAQVALGTELVGSPQVETKENQATIRWKTSDPSGSVVKFGTDAKNLMRNATGDLGDNHQVTLENLRPGTTYFYEVGTAKRGLKQDSFTTPGNAPAPQVKTNPLAPVAKPMAKPAAAPAPEAAKEENKPLLKKLFGFFSKDEAPATPAAAPAPAEKAKPAPAKSAVQDAPATRQTWGNMSSLEDHFIRHGRDFNAKTADEYAAGAWRFLQKAMDEGLPVKQDPDNGSLRVWDPSNRTFASYNSDLTTKTYFRPNSYDYFDRQPGNKVKLVRKKAASSTSPGSSSGTDRNSPKNSCKPHR